jgi:NodT family efflux transporter outer membrane factor (OMF) lipoprotein
MRRSVSKSTVFAATLTRTRRLAPVFGSLILLPALSGCFVGTEKPEIALEVAGNYRYGGRKADAALPQLDWWRGFRSRELTGLIEAAQVQNLDIAGAVARVVQADAQVRITGATLLPTLTGNASATRSQQPGATTAASVFNANLTASYTIDFWGRNRALVLSSEQTAIASRYDRDVITLSILATVANTYFQRLSAQDRLRIARGNLDAATRVLTLIQQRLAVGTASQLDIAQQESLVATQRAAIPPLEIAARQAEVALAVLIGRAPENFRVRGGAMNAIRVPRVTPGLPSDILNQRPDVREAEANLASANHSVEAARAAFFPNIQLTGIGGTQSAALAALFGPGAWYYTLAAAAAQPIFDGFLRLGQLQLSKGQQQELLAAYKKSVLSAFSDVEQALIAVEQQTTRERLQGEVVRAAAEAFRLSEQRLNEGTVDLVTVLTTQQTLFQAQDTLAQVRLARLQAVVSLYLALGGGWPPLEGAQPIAR